MIKKLLQIIQDDNKNISSVRIVMILSVCFFFSNWIYALIINGEFRPSWELIVFVVFMVCGKVIQKFGEEKEYEL